MTFSGVLRWDEETYFALDYFLISWSNSIDGLDFNDGWAYLSGGGVDCDVNDWCDSFLMLLSDSTLIETTDYYFYSFVGVINIFWQEIEVLCVD